MRGVIRNIPAGIFMLLFVINPVSALDGSTIDRWIDSMEELQKWGDEQPDAAIDPDFNADMGNPMDFDFGAMLERSAREHSEVRSIVRDYGFSPEEWADVGTRIFHAFMAIEMKGASAEAEREMAEAREQIENNPHMSEQQKEMMRQQLQHAQQAMGGMVEDVPDDDRRAVESRRDRLNRFFEVDQ